MGLFENKAAKAAKENVEKQYEYDVARWEYDWQTIQDNYEYQSDAYDIALWNQEQNIAFQEQRSQDEYNHMLAMRDFDYNNQIAAYNASVEAYEKQLDFNNLAHEITSNDNTRVFNEKLIAIGFQNEEVINKLNDAVDDFGLNVKELDLAKKAKDSEISQKAQDLGRKQMTAAGAQAAMGQTGRTARKNMQSQMAAFGYQQSALNELLVREGASLGLAWDKQNQQLSRVSTQTELNQRQLQESMKSAGAQFESDAQHAAMQKYSADLAAENAIAPEPQLPPLQPAPLALPRPKSLPPQEPPSWERYETGKPIKGSVAQPGFWQQAAGIVKTGIQIYAATKGIPTGGSDDRFKYNLNRVGTSPSGIPKYTFKYRLDGPHGPTWTGTSAQDLLAMGRGDAVFQKEKDGFYYVDYSKLDVDMEVVTT